MIDSHIHLDMYEERDLREMLEQLPVYGVERVVAVSLHLQSCKQNRDLSLAYPGQVLPAYGFHPERELPDEKQIAQLIEWIYTHREQMIAIGEVGLPYYKRTEAEERGEPFDMEPYVRLLDSFIALAAELDKPIILHAVYDDADIACDLLEKHKVRQAHFHWFKGSEQTVRRMIANGYFISFTPDIVYEEEIQQLAKLYPLEQVMAETDGPWPFEGPFEGQMTHPRMVRCVIKQLSTIKEVSTAEAMDQVRRNTEAFYRLSPL